MEKDERLQGEGKHLSPVSMLFADKIFKEEGNGKIHIAGVCGIIHSEKFPDFLPNFAIFQRFKAPLQRGVLDISLKVKYLDGDQKQILDVVHQFDPGENKTVQFFTNIHNFPIIREGKIGFTMMVNGDYLNSDSIQVVKAGPPADAKVIEWEA